MTGMLSVTLFADSFASQLALSHVEYSPTIGARRQATKKDVCPLSYQKMQALHGMCTYCMYCKQHMYMQYIQMLMYGQIPLQTPQSQVPLAANALFCCSSLISSVGAFTGIYSGLQGTQPSWKTRACQ